MPKRPTKSSAPIVTAFSIVNQVTGPPFFADLEEAGIRKKLMREIERGGGTEGDATQARGKTTKPGRTRAGRKNGA